MIVRDRSNGYYVAATLEAMMAAISPQDYDVIFGVFRSLARAEWFERTDENEKACARFVLLQYNAGGVSAAELYARCIQQAQERFARRH